MNVKQSKKGRWWIGIPIAMLENLIQAEKIVRAMLEMQPATRAESEFSEVLNHLLDLIAQAVDELQKEG